MIRDDEEVQRPYELGKMAQRRTDLLATGESERLIGSKHVADHAGIRRIRRVQVGIAPVKVAREIVTDHG